MLTDIIFLFLFSLVYSSLIGQGGGTCATAAASPITLPFSATGQSTCGFGNNYTSANSNACGSTLYLGGEDHLYAFTPTVSGNININLTSTSTWVGLIFWTLTSMISEKSLSG